MGRGGCRRRQTRRRPKVSAWTRTSEDFRLPCGVSGIRASTLAPCRGLAAVFCTAGAGAGSRGCRSQEAALFLTSLGSTRANSSARGHLTISAVQPVLRGQQSGCSLSDVRMLWHHLALDLLQGMRGRGLYTAEEAAARARIEASGIAWMQAMASSV